MVLQRVGRFGGHFLFFWSGALGSVTGVGDDDDMCAVGQPVHSRRGQQHSSGIREELAPLCCGGIGSRLGHLIVRASGGPPVSMERTTQYGPAACFYQRVLLESLEPADFVPHLIGSHSVQQVEQAAYCFTDGKLIRNDNPIVFLATV